MDLAEAWLVHLRRRDFQSHLYEPDGDEVGLPQATAGGRTTSRIRSALPVEHGQHEGPRAGAADPPYRGPENRGRCHLLLQPSDAAWSPVGLLSLSGRARAHT